MKISYICPKSKLFVRGKQHNTLILKKILKTKKGKYGMVFLACLIVPVALIFVEISNSVFRNLKIMENSGKSDTKPVYYAGFIPEKRVEFGIILDSFLVFKDKIKANENLAGILSRFNVDYSLIDKLVKKSKNIFNVRKIRTGKPYTVLYSKDSSCSAKYFIYEQSPTDYVVCDLRDTLNVYKEQKDVEVKIQTASGIIHASLYETMIDNEINPLLAIELSEIYAWAIDFYRIQKEDKFKVIYEEKFVDGRSIGFGKILAAYFNHAGKDFYAFYFTPACPQDNKDSIGDYFDECGSSLRKALLKSPLKYSRITSRYTHRRFHPILKRYKPHYGIDYAAATGTPIRSVGDGIVLEARYKKGNGNYVKIRHNSVYTTQYLHMSKRAKGIRPGVWVNQGQVIGYVGSTGLATGPHLCYRFWKHGRQVNPLKVEIPPSKPVKHEYREEYYQNINEIIRELNVIEYQKKWLKTVNSG
ncbi:MAG: peptidoglycan DD-metalloendopeptidase family protein [Cytophagales bacterium]|nr:peptidoglycan DD-metalloendopeptidase family protein [Cytophagales bacterium]